MENGRTGDQELLVARSDQRGEEICGRMQCLPAKQKLHRTASRKIDAKLNPGKTLDVRGTLGEAPSHTAV